VDKCSKQPPRCHDTKKLNGEENTMQCQVCRAAGANMKRCEACNNVWCQYCATHGKGHYPKQTAGNKCPYCGAYNKVKQA